MALTEPKRRKRTLVCLEIFTLCILLLVTRVFYLQIINAEELEEKASNQWVRSTTIAALRGEITDRNGEILAQSGTSDTILLRPRQIQASELNTDENPNAAAELVAQILAPILEMEYDDVLEVALDTDKYEIWLKRQLSREMANEAREAIEEYDLPGVGFTVDTKRYYPKKDFLTQVLGFTSLDGNGIEGLEAYYDEYLAGEEGKVSTESDNSGNAVAFGDEYYIPATNGYTIELTIDYAIQSFLEKAADEAADRYNAKSVQAIAMDPDTGEILGLTVKPDYDNNNPPRDDIETLNALSRNRVIADVYEPGSVFKILTTAIALEDDPSWLSHTFTCNGGRTVEGEFIKCWSSNHTEPESLADALANSCNPCFIDMVLSVGVESFYDELHDFGFGSITGIDAAGEASGILMDEDSVRQADLARIGFGQSISATPLQMITAISAVINGGTLYQPTLVHRILTSEGEVVSETEHTAVRQVISEETSETMRGLLEKVVEHNASLPLDDYTWGGKSGTAQKYDENGKIMEDAHIASFIGFAPVDDPKIIVLFVVDEPDAYVDFGSVIAGPYVKEVLEQSLPYMQIPTSSDAENDTVKVQVPKLLDLSKEEAIDELRRQGLKYSISGEGVVVDQMPAAGTVVPKGTEVMIYLKEEESITEDSVKMPNVCGLTLEKAKEQLEEMGLSVYVEGSGIVQWQYPLEGTIIKKGSLVRLQCEEQ